MATILDSINQMNAIQTEYNRMNAIQNYCEFCKAKEIELGLSKSSYSDMAEFLNQPTARDTMQIAFDQCNSFEKRFELLYDTPLQRAIQEYQEREKQFSQYQLEALKGISQHRDEMNSILQGIGVPYNAILELKKSNANYLFNFEGNYENQYQQLYKNIPDTSRIVIAEDTYTNRDELFVQEEDGTKYPLSYTKEIAGSKIIFPDISENEIIDFRNYLASKSFLSYKHPVGIKIYKYFESYKDQFLTTLKDDVTLFRSREHKYEGQKKFIPQKVLELSYGITGANRFNFPGKIVLYMADNYGTAKSEIKKGKECTTIKANLLKEIQILDMTQNSNIIFEYCQEKSSDEDNYPSEYLFPTFIADVCDDLGIRGIKYKSTVDDGNCYVFFNLHSDSFTNICDADLNK